MHPQRFKVLVEEMHRKWLSHVFGGITHHANGIDLRTDTFGIELKTRMRSFTLKNGTVRPCHGQFTLHEEQLCCFEEAYSSRLELYLCFLRYDFARPVRSLPQHQHDLVDLVSGREAWFVPWAFTGKYSVSSAFTGPYRYIPFRDVVTYALQCNFRMFIRDGADLHVPRDSVLDHALDPSFVESTSEDDDIPF